MAEIRIHKTPFKTRVLRLVLGWDQHLPLKQISAIQSQDHRPMSVSTGSEKKAYSSMSFLDT